MALSGLVEPFSVGAPPVEEDDSGLILPEPEDYRLIDFLNEKVDDVVEGYACPPRCDLPPKLPPDLSPTVLAVTLSGKDAPLVLRRNPETEGAILAALQWLCKHQSREGRWEIDSCGDCPSPGEPDHDVGRIGLSLLAFLGAGYTQRSNRYGHVLHRGLQRLCAEQDSFGCIGARGTKYMYGHILATQALCEAYRLTRSGFLRQPAERAVQFLIAAQNPGKGWRYSHKPGDNDSMVTGWAVLALKSAEAAGLHVPAEAYHGAMRWFDGATEMNYGRASYDGIGSKYMTYLPFPSFDYHETCTAMGLLARRRITPALPESPHSWGHELFLRDKPGREPVSRDFVYWHFGTGALREAIGTSGPKWEAWRTALTEALLPLQNGAADSCRFGSWEPADRWSAEGGRAYATAMNALTLEAICR